MNRYIKIVTICSFFAGIVGIAGCTKKDVTLPSPEETASESSAADSADDASTSPYVTLTYSDPETISLEEARQFSLGVPQPSGALSPEQIKEYGTYVFEAFAKHPELVGDVSIIDPSFSANDVATSVPTVVASANSRTVLIFSGCTPHNCGGTTKVIAYDLNTHALAMVEEQEDENLKSGVEYTMYGNPDTYMKQILLATIASP
jgi:hypothetical protein